MTEPLRWGVLGNATIARKCVIAAIQASGNGRVVAIGSRHPAAAAETARRFDIPAVHEGYRALLQNAAVEAVYIPLPNHLHRPWTLAALAAGKHVLCEKPLALDAAEAAEMAAAAEAAGRLLMEAFMYRFHPRSRRIRQLVAAGRLGTPRLVRAAFCFRMADELLASGDNIRLRPETGGGALLDTGCYAVSVARWLLGAEPEAVQAQALFHQSGVDLQVAGLLAFPGGALATVEAGFVSALQQTWAIFGSEGAVELPHDAFIPFEKPARFYLRGRDEQLPRRHTVRGADEYRLMVQHFAAAVRGREPPAWDPAESVANMRVLDALRQAARSGKRVTL